MSPPKLPLETRKQYEARISVLEMTILELRGIIKNRENKVAPLETELSELKEYIAILEKFIFHNLKTKKL